MFSQCQVALVIYSATYFLKLRGFCLYSLTVEILEEGREKRELAVTRPIIRLYNGEG